MKKIRLFLIITSTVLLISALLFLKRQVIQVNRAIREEPTAIANAPSEAEPTAIDPAAASEAVPETAKTEEPAAIDPATASEAVPETAESEEPAPSVQTLTVTATGDCTLGKTQTQSYSGSFCKYYDTYGADYFLKNVRDVFEADDFTIVNLECVLSTSNDRVEKEFNLKGEPAYTSILTGSSVEACSLGNNHTYDYGETGFQDTKDALTKSGLVYAYSEQSGIYTTADGVSIGIVSASLLSRSAEKLQALIDQIGALKTNGAQIVIACCHWGTEREYSANAYQQATAHTLIDAGADLIIGNHPHVLQGVEVYNGKVICYSLGNFCFGGNKNPSDKNTMLYQQTFTLIDGIVQTDAIDARILPCRVSSQDGYNDFQPCIAEGEAAQTIIDLVNACSAPFGDFHFDASTGSLVCPP